MADSRSTALRGNGVERDTQTVQRITLYVTSALAVGMLLVAIFAALRGEPTAAKSFALSTLMTILVGSVMQLILRGRVLHSSRVGLLGMLVVYVSAPALAAIPVIGTTALLTPTGAYFEMLSAFTTTGATMVRDLDLMPHSVILWRAMVAALGGFFCLAAALAILAPLAIGGFEVSHMIDREAQTTNYAFLCASEGARTLRDRNRVDWAISVLGMPYLIAILACTTAIAGAGAPAFDAVCLALSTVSTTGFVPRQDGLSLYDAPIIEAMVIGFMIPAAIGVSTHLAASRGGLKNYIRDPELRYLGLCVGTVTILLFLRHWVGAIETATTDDLAAAFDAAWGTVFMAVSFATTTGFVSSSWQAATAWSGLETPGIALIGLALIGGGAASTAGGVKLIRAAVLAKHAIREVGLLSQPSAMRSVSSGGRTVTVEALRIVWIFVMLYLLSMAAVALAVAAAGVSAPIAIGSAVAAISNTGPALGLLGEGARFADLPPAASLVLCVAMIVGRVETLAVVAVASATSWRN